MWLTEAQWYFMSQSSEAKTDASLVKGLLSALHILAFLYVYFIVLVGPPRMALNPSLYLSLNLQEYRIQLISICLTLFRWFLNILFKVIQSIGHPEVEYKTADVKGGVEVNVS